MGNSATAVSGLEHVREAARVAEAHATVSDVMQTSVPYLREEMWTDAVARQFSRRPAHDMPVVDADGRPVGMLGHADLEAAPFAVADACEEELREQRRAARRLGISRGLHLEHAPSRARVRDVMVPYVATIPVSASVAEAASRLLDEHIDRLLVVLRDGTLTGQITARDVARVLRSGRA